MTRATGDPPIDWDRLEQLYAEITNIPIAARAARVAIVGYADRALARELGSLLSCESRVEPFFRELTRAAVATAADLVGTDAT